MSQAWFGEPAEGARTMDHERDVDEDGTKVDPADPMEGRRFHPTGGQVPTGDTVVDPRTAADEVTDALVEPDGGRPEAVDGPGEGPTSPPDTSR
jgi:hypothetical protein